MSEGDIKDRIEPLLNRLPAVASPKGHVHFKTKLMWTTGILILYFVLTNVPLFGLAPESQDLFAMYRAIMAGTSGSVMQLGIGPIVTASIILQLLVGADIIKLDLSDLRDQSIFDGTQKLLVIVMTVLEALPQVMGGWLQPDVALANILGVGVNVILWLIFIQVCIGGILILFMDEVVSKWGIGSGVGLFIVAGISQALVGGLINWQPDTTGLPIGLLPKWYHILTTVPAGQLLTGSGLVFTLLRGGIIALIGTVVVFLLVAYLESVRVEIPLSHSAVRGARGRFPVKLIYASVLPVILVRALQANIQMVGMLLWRSRLPFLGHNPAIGAFSGSSAISGLMYYLQPLHGPGDWIPYFVWQNPEFVNLQLWQIALRAATDITVMVVGGMIFALFWIETSGMDAKSVAEQIQGSGMQIPGFRRDIGVLKRVLQRYIPKVTVIGGALTGALTVAASLFGLVGNVGGMGLLLTVDIVYQMYERIASEQLMEMYPMIRKFIGRG